MMALIGFQSIINLGMNLRVLPVIGITLPFFSAGGSSVLTLYLGIGLVLSVSFSERTRKTNRLLR
jgi:rod shape determining protein RodA